MITGVILAGGRSTRMGTDKAFVEMAGRPFIEHVADALGQVVTSVVTVGREEPIAGLRGVPDRTCGVPGPLRGLASALASVKARQVLLLAVDQPFVAPATLANLVELASPERAVVPVADGFRQVTTALYPTAWLRDVEDEADAGGSIQTLLDRMPYRAVGPDEWRAWGEDGRSWFSVDTPDALDVAMRRYREADGPDQIRAGE